MHKLKAMLYHKDNYKLIENKHISDVAERYKKEPNVEVDAKELSFEFEAFLFQAKSLLEMTIKVLEILFPKHFHIGSFSKKGKTLIKNLEQFKKVTQIQDKRIKDEDRLAKVKARRLATIDNIINMLKEDKISWLEKLIEMRNEITHHNAIRNMVYKVSSEYEGKIAIKPPEILGEYPHAYMEVIFRNIIEFIQEFLCLCIELWLPPVFRLTKVGNENTTIQEFIKAGMSAADYIKYELTFQEL